MVSLVDDTSSSAAAGDAVATPTDAEIQKLQQQINRQFAIDDYKGAGGYFES